MSRPRNAVEPSRRQAFIQQSTRHEVDAPENERRTQQAEASEDDQRRTLKLKRQKMIHGGRTNKVRRQRTIREVRAVKVKVRIQSAKDAPSR